MGSGQSTATGSRTSHRSCLKLSQMVSHTLPTATELLQDTNVLLSDVANLSILQPALVSSKPQIVVTQRIMLKWSSKVLHHRRELKVAIRAKTTRNQRRCSFARGCGARLNTQGHTKGRTFHCRNHTRSQWQAMPVRAASPHRKRPNASMIQDVLNHRKTKVIPVDKPADCFECPNHSFLGHGKKGWLRPYESHSSACTHLDGW